MKQIALFIAFSWTLAVHAATPDTLVILQKNSSWMNSLPGGGKMECTISASCPQSNSDGFNSAFAQWVNEGMKLLFSVDETIKTDVLLSQFEQQFYKTRDAEIVSMMKGKTVLRPFNVVLDAEIRKVHEKSSYITFRQTYVHYPADGSRREIKREKTFYKSSGASLDWKDVVVAKKQSQFNKALVQAVGAYFGVRDLENLKSLMKNGSAVSYSNFPLPSEGPAFEATGIRIIYAAGEIATAELGSPSVVIPYSSISSCLTSSAKKLTK